MALETAKAREWRGLALPITRVGGEYFASKYVYDLVWSSIIMILGTPVGSRPMRPRFGSPFPELVFEPNDDIVARLAEFYARRSIAAQEPRAVLKNVKVVVMEETLQIELTFSLTISPDAVTRGIVVKRFADFHILRMYER